MNGSSIFWAFGRKRLIKQRSIQDCRAAGGIHDLDFGKRKEKISWLAPPSQVLYSYEIQSASIILILEVQNMKGLVHSIAFGFWWFAGRL